METGKQDLRMLIEVKADTNFGDHSLRYIARPVVIKKDGPYGMGSDTPELEYFTVDSWRDVHHGFYPVSVGYRDVYRLELRQAEDMVKLLRKVTRTVERLQTKYGYAPNIAAGTAYVAEAIGITAAEPFIRRVKPADDWHGTGYREMTTTALNSWIRDQDRKWSEEHGCEANAAA